MESMLNFFNNFYLHFSDAAKSADVAKNILLGLGYSQSFSFWGADVFDIIRQNIFFNTWIPPVMPFSIALIFKLFGVSDFAVIITSSFYFLLTLVFVFLLARKLFSSNLIGTLSVLAVGFNNDLINYTTSGASESPFIFEIVAATYFISLKKIWGNIVAAMLMILMYFTRPQAFIYIAGLIFYWLLITFKTKKALIIFAVVIIAGLLVDYYVLRGLTGRYFFIFYNGSRRYYRNSSIRWRFSLRFFKRR